MEVLCNNYQSPNLIGPYCFWGKAQGIRLCSPECFSACTGWARDYSILLWLYAVFSLVPRPHLKIVKRAWSHCYQELTVCLCTRVHVFLPDIPVEGSPSGNVGLDYGAFLLRTELFKRANQIVACPITGATHWRPDACADANWWQLKPCRGHNFHIWSAPACAKAQESRQFYQIDFP